MFKKIVFASLLLVGVATEVRAQQCPSLPNGINGNPYVRYNYLDARTSQNATYAQVLNTAVTTAPQLWGIVGLVATGANAPIEAKISGTITFRVQDFSSPDVEVRVVRGFNFNDPIVYDEKVILDTSLVGPQPFTFFAADKNAVPTANQIVYTAFVRDINGGAVRVGPESFNAVALSTSAAKNVAVIDARTSQNASYGEVINVPVATSSQLWGQLGLNTYGAGSLLRTQFEGKVTMKLTSFDDPAPTVELVVVRGYNPTDPVVFSIRKMLNPNDAGSQDISFIGSDYNVPNSGFLVYTAFVKANKAGASRVGPESFNAVAFANGSYQNVKPLDSRAWYAQTIPDQPAFVTTQACPWSYMVINTATAGSLLRIQLEGSVALQAGSASPTVEIIVVRGTSLSDPIVFTVKKTPDPSLLFSPEVYNFVASDYNVPKPASGYLIYTAFIRSTTSQNVIERVGPEALNGAGFSNP